MSRTVRDSSIVSTAGRSPAKIAELKAKYARGLGELPLKHNRDRKIMGDWAMTRQTKRCMKRLRNRRDRRTYRIVWEEPAQIVEEDFEPFMISFFGLMSL